MATLTKFEPFVEDLAEGRHDLTLDTLSVSFNATQPTTTIGVLSGLTPISTAAFTSFTITTTTGSQTNGTYLLELADLTVGATGSSGPTFRYVTVYNVTSSSDSLIGFYDNGSNLDLAADETLTLDWASSSGALQIT